MGLSTYLSDILGLQLTIDKWVPPAKMPLYLAHSAQYMLCSCAGARFVAAFMPDGATLPHMKRTVDQLATWVELPIVLVGDDIDARQRKALLQQGYPHVVPNKQAFLPFLAFVSTEAAERRKLGGALSSGAQALLVTMLARPEVETLEDMRRVTGFSASSVSRGVDELSREGFAKKAKRGRTVYFELELPRNEVIGRAKHALSSPVLKTFYAMRSTGTDELPSAGESALADRTMLAAPRVRQVAVSREKAQKMHLVEVLRGELPDCETVQVQVWRYDPLVAGGGCVDDVSLALSLHEEGDERVLGELGELFGDESLWR